MATGTKQINMIDHAKTEFNITAMFPDPTIIGTQTISGHLKPLTKEEIAEVDKPRDPLKVGW